MTFPWLRIATGVNWAVALLWAWRSAASLRNLPKVPNLLDLPQPAPARHEGAQITVIVPARNEEQAIAQTLRSLLAQSIPVSIVSVDDRSTDKTGTIADQIAAEPLAGGKTLSVLHIERLPPGWMGKTHAMALAARQSTTPWLLFTDGDVVFRHDALQRAISFAESTRADHLVIFPTLLFRSPGERMMIGFFHAVGALFARPWRIPDPSARRDSIGIGAFNLVRAHAYRAVGGFEALRMEVIEDMRLGFTLKHAGFRQQVAFGPGLVSLHWGAGALGIVRNLTKNAFAAFRFRTGKLLAACLLLAVISFAPLAGWFGPWKLRLPSAVALTSMLLVYRYYRRFTGTGVVYVLTYPLAAVLMLYTLLGSMLITLKQGGVEWRGTFYPLRELRRNAGPVR